MSDAVVSEAKVRDYLLATSHPDGRGKATFFLARGFTPQDWHEMADALRAQGSENPVERYESTPYGRKIIVRCHMVTPDGRNPCILTVWMEEDGKPIRLVTAYPG
ncbi:DUF6883 domain-containing protein [Methylobacterium sp. Leaf112]|uniref:DUF6883 domain-containing protein n=1 Tax=Methylobacterium sp. Leaf112 TaxID=1736258 RepID=UPI0012E8344F|nr:DUF6883 domain-containing protein [Methylobacterium sp. Leaf112]